MKANFCRKNPSQEIFLAMTWITNWSGKRMKNQKVKVSRKENDLDNELVREKMKNRKAKVSSKEAAEMSDPY
jgi:hypothetical protein